MNIDAKQMAQALEEIKAKLSDMILRTPTGSDRSALTDAKIIILTLEAKITSLLDAVKKYKGKWMRLNRLSQADETEKDKVIRIQHRTIGKLNETKKRLQAHVKAASKQVEMEREKQIALERELAEAREPMEMLEKMKGRLEWCAGYSQQWQYSDHVDGEWWEIEDTPAAVIRAAAKAMEKDDV